MLVLIPKLCKAKSETYQKITDELPIKNEGNIYNNKSGF